jgi:hypothetical protein
MQQLNLEDFIAPFGANMQVKLRDYAARDDIQVLVAWDNAGKLSVSAFTQLPEEWPDTGVSFFSKLPVPDKPAEVIKSKTMQALDLVAAGMKPYAAAKQVGVQRQAVHRALSRRDGKQICPCCGQVVRAGFSVKNPADDSASA